MSILKVLITQKNVFCNYVCMGMDVNETYCGDHFAMHTSVASLYCTPDSIMIYVNYISS